MPSSFLSPLAAPAPPAAHSAQASDLPARQSQGQDFGQALARSVSNAQHNTRREQLALEARSTEARRADANRIERPSKQHKAKGEDGKDKELQSKDPSSAAVGVLDWLGSQVKAQALGRSADDAQGQTTSSLAGMRTASRSDAATVNDAQAKNTAMAKADGAPALAKPEQVEAGLPSESRALASPDAHQAATTTSNASASRTGAADLLQPEPLAPSGMERSEDPQKSEGLQAMQVGQGFASSAGTQANVLAGNARSGAASRPETQGVAAARTGPRAEPAAPAAPAATAQAGKASLASAASGRISSAASASAFASASASASAKAQANKAGADGAQPSDARNTAGVRAEVAARAGAGEGFAGIALDAPASAQTASETVAAPGSAQPGQIWGQIEPEVGTPAWHQALSQQIMQMRRGDANEAELQLNPAGLGPLRIKLSLRNQELNAEFSAAHAQVREALEAALPQLREALQQGDMKLGQAWVEPPNAQGTRGNTGNMNESGRQAYGQAAQDGSEGGRENARIGLAGRVNLLGSAGSAASVLTGVTSDQGPGQRLNTFA